MNGDTLHSTLRELRRLSTLPRLWAIFAIVTALFAVTGPFGTFSELSALPRLGYWLVIQGLAWAIALTFVIGFDFGLERRINSPLPRMLIGAICAAPLITFAVMLVNHWSMGTQITAQNYLAGFLQVLPVTIILSLVCWLTLHGTTNALESDKQAISAESGARPAPARLLDRLPVERRAPLIRLQVEDHYVRVVTTRGTELVLMRLADAISETTPTPGRQVHRSHWIADNPQNRLSREPGKNGRLLIMTTDGAEIPVSRTYQAEVRAWLSD